MKKSKKIALTVSAVCIATGVLLGVAAAAVIDFDFERLSTMRFTSEEYNITEVFDDINIRSDLCDISLLPSTDGKTRAVCAESDGADNKFGHSVTVENGVLNITFTDNRKWYERIGIYWDDEDISVKLYLPQGEYNALYIESTGGDISVPSGFGFQSTEAYTASGDIEFFASAADRLSLKSTSGDIYVSGASCGALEAVTSSGDIGIASLSAASIKAESTSGDIELKDAAVSGEVRTDSISGDIWLGNITAEGLRSESTSGDNGLKAVLTSGKTELYSTSGDIELDSCDAGELCLKSTSGSITGSLLSAKQFETHTTSGYVSVPASSGGAKCAVTTVSGDINITVK